MNDFTTDVHQWMITCFGEEIASDQEERCFRFLEEALELVQSLDCTKEDALKLVDYVYDRPVGEPHQEVGGVMITIAALCNAANIDLDKALSDELDRVWTKVEQIRAKQKNKPIRSPLPGKII